MGLIRRFLTISTFHERLIERLLDQNQELLNRLLWKEGIPEIEKVEAKPEVSAVSHLRQYPMDMKGALEAAAHDAASDPELMAQAQDNAQHNQFWRDVVERAEVLMEEVM